MANKPRFCKWCGLEIKRGSKCFKVPNLSPIHAYCYREYLTEQKGEIYADFKVNKMLKKQEEDKIARQKRTIENEKNKEKNLKTRNMLLHYLKETYDTTLPRQFFVKLSNINNGHYKRLKEKISYEDLLDMFKRKQNELNRIAASNERRGKGYGNNYHRLCYDLEVIISKYDSYKRWKEKQQLFTVEKEEMKQTTKSLINTVLNRQKSNEQHTKKSNNIGDLLDEIF